MSDEKTLAEDEAELKRLQHHYRAYPDLVESFAERAEIIHLARRYLALRKEFAPFGMDIGGKHSWCWRGSPSRMVGETIDAAADRLLENES